MGKQHSRKISIITPSLNQAAYIGEAIESVFKQDYSNVEHIIFDGGSTDGTLEIIQEYASKYNIIWKSVQGLGIYQALNQAIDKASGAIIGWLNCDDYFSQNIFQKAIDAFTSDPNVKIVCGDANLFRRDTAGNNIILKVYPHYRGSRFISNKENLNTAHLNACFFDATLINETGEFDSTYEIASDRDYMLRIFRLIPASKHLNTVVYNYRLHADSLTFNQYDQIASEVQLGSSSKAWEELLDIAIKHITNSQSPKATKIWCRNYINKYTLSRFRTSIVDGKISNAVFYAKLGQRHNVYWVLIMVLNSLGTLKGIIVRKIKKTIGLEIKT